jgi:hypothetical protein
MKEALNVSFPDSCPRFATLDPDIIFSTNQEISEEVLRTYYEKLVSELRSPPPFIIKPTDGFLSVGVSKIFGFEDFVSWKKTLPPPTLGASAYEIEEYIEGDIYYGVGIIEGGKKKFIGIGKYINNNLDFLKLGIPIGGRVVDEHEEPEVHGKLFEFTENVLEGFGNHDGTYHVEIFFSEARGRPIFLEAANRPGGADHVPSFFLVYGYNLFEWDIIIHGNFRRPEIVIPEKRKYLVWASLPKSKSGKVEHVGLPPSLEGRLRVDWFFGPGDQVDTSKDCLDQFGYVVGVEEDYRGCQELCGMIESLTEFYSVS